MAPLRLTRHAARLPSTDLYLLNACGDRLGRWWRRGPMRRTGANAFIAGQTMVLIRQDSARVMQAALHWAGRLVYVVDDDIAGAIDSDSLPDAYRRRLASFHAGYHLPLLARADALLVPSDALAARLASLPELSGRAHVIRHINPVWAAPLADTAHFAPLAAGGTLRIVHLGSGSHHAALSLIVPAVLRLLDSDPLTHFTYLAARAIDPALEAHPHARRLEPKPWGEYAGWLARQRFHLALYPLMPDGFDRARSINKLVEHAVVGAAGLYPADWDPTALLDADNAPGALHAPPHPGDWEAALLDACACRPTLQSRAANAAAAITALDLASRQRALWDSLL